MSETTSAAVDEVEIPDSFESDQKRNLVKSMRLFDLVFFSVATVVSLDTIGQISTSGAQTFTWMLVLCAAFILPYALLMAEMGSAYVAEGGPYIWMRMAWGRTAAAVGAVLYWVTNPLWLGGSLAFIATAAWGRAMGTIETGSLMDYVFKLLFVWVGILTAIVSLKRGKWIPSIGAFVKIGLVVIVCASAVIYALKHGVHGYGLSSFSPTVAGFMGAVPVLAFALSGFEAETAASEEMFDAKKDVPKSIGASAVVSCLCYLAPVFAILTVVPAKEITGVGGFLDAAKITFSVYGGASGAMFDIAALAFVFTIVTQGASWMMGSDRVLAAAGLDGTMPRYFGAISERFGTPVRVNLMSGVVASVFTVVATIFASGAGASSFAIVLSIAVSTVLLSYIIIYPSAIRLRKKLPHAERPYQVPGGMPGLWIATILTMFFILLGSIEAVFPGIPEGVLGIHYNFMSTWDVTRGHFEALTLGTLAVICVFSLVGVKLGARERRRYGEGGPDPLEAYAQAPVAAD